jgi:MFS family permease
LRPIQKYRSRIPIKNRTRKSADVTATKTGQGDTRRYRRLPTQADYWRLWLIGLVMFAVRWVEMLVIAVFAYQVTGSAFIVTMLTMLRILPMALFGAFMGAATDRIDRRLALFGILLLMLTTSAALTVLAWTGRLEIWHLALSAFINGSAWATDNSLRRIMIGEVVGTEHMATAMALDSGANNASRMLGPALGGALLATAGVQAPFAVSVALYLVAIVAVLGLGYRNRIAAATSISMLSRIAEGLKEVRRSQRLSGIYAVTAIFNIFGWPFYSLVPVIGKDNLALGPQGVGVLSSMDGVGAMFGAAVVVVLARPSHYHMLYVGSAGLFQVMLTAFALMPQPFAAGFFLMMTGFGGACFGVMQTTLIYRAVTPAMRARMLGLLSVCIGLGPIGFLQVGFLAQAFGARGAIIIIGVEGLIALALTRRLWRHGADVIGEPEAAALADQPS